MVRARGAGVKFAFFSTRPESPVHWLGFCWGGKMTMQIACDKEVAARFAAVGGIHASLKDPKGDVQRAAQALLPVMLLQAGNDADVRPVLEALQGTAMAASHVCRTYHEQKHGWCGARGDRGDASVAAAVRSALQVSVDFFRNAAMRA